MTNKRNTVLYTGMTGKGEARFAEHRTRLSPNSFTARYHITKVVYVDAFPTASEAAAAEKRIKGWTRKKKIALVHSVNPEWKELMPTESIITR